MASWHERLVLMPAQWRMVRRCRAGSRIHILVSRSRDGRFIAGIVARFGIDVALGSSSRGGAAAMRQMVGVLAAGGHVGMTPDGPRGPRRRAAPGVVQLAALAGVPILPCSAQVSRKWVLRSWDRMVIPRPFGRGVVVCGEVISVPREGWREALPVVEGALTAVAEAADRWCAERAGG